MKNRLIIGLFFCMVAAQVISPFSMIIKREYVLKYGQRFKFKTAPVDPYDAFRGRYVALQLAEDSVPVKGTQFSRGQSAYALININQEGFAELATLTANRPEGEPYLQVKIRHVSGDNAHLDLPIERYYMEEKSAPLAEKVYREYNIQDKQDAYVVVRVKEGFAIIEDLYVGGRRIEEAIKIQQKNKAPYVLETGG